MSFQATQEYPTGIFDLYPLYYGARAWLTTGSAYNLKAVAPAADAGLPLLELGNAYPFPAVLLVVPLCFFPPAVAGVLWSGLVALALVLTAALTKRAWWLLLYLPLVEA